MSIAAWKPNAGRRPDPDTLRRIAKKLEDDTGHLDEHPDPKFRGVGYVMLSGDALRDLIKVLSDAANWIENPLGPPVMIRGGGQGFRIG